MPPGQGNGNAAVIPVTKVGLPGECSSLSADTRTCPGSGIPRAALKEGTVGGIWKNGNPLKVVITMGLR